MRARRNVDPIAMRVMTPQAVTQPKLPPRYVVVGKERVRRAWPKPTRDWWQMWADSPLSDEFTATDWSELAATALLHAAVMDGCLKYAAELRLRVAKFGATPEDRARLRITFVTADKAEQKPPAKPRTDRYQGLRATS
jgi:hypothetical protein